MDYRGLKQWINRKLICNYSDNCISIVILWMIFCSPPFEIIANWTYLDFGQQRFSVTWSVTERRQELLTADSARFNGANLQKREHIKAEKPELTHQSFLFTSWSIMGTVVVFVYSSDTLDYIIYHLQNGLGLKFRAIGKRVMTMKRHNLSEWVILNQKLNYWTDFRVKVNKWCFCCLIWTTS